MKKKLAIFVLIVMAAAITAGASPLVKYSFKRKTNVKLSDLSSYIRGSMNDFGLDILKSEVSGNKLGNVMISPLSIFTALNITALGAAGDTREQMKKVMKVDQISDSDRNESMNALINYIRNTADNKKAGSTEIYNSIWINKGISLKDTFLRDARVFYDSDVFSRDFSNPGTVKDINNWVSDKSKGLIKKAVDRLSSNTQVSIYDVVHFLGKWKEEFDVRLTKKEAFTASNGTKLLVPMMNGLREMAYYEDKRVKAGILDFDNGNIMIIVPKGEISNFIKNLSIDDINEYSEGAESSQVKLKLPKLDINYKTTLNNSLIKLGMVLPFDENKANFDNLHADKNSFYISSIMHQSVLKLDEKKAEAAAVTGVYLTCKAVRVDKEKELYANKPFVFLIRNDDNILFAGKVEKP